jgi:hypothetical protein
MNGPEGQGKAYEVYSIALTNQPNNVKNAPIIIVQNTFRPIARWRY